jgi:hypothetical protein
MVLADDELANSLAIGGRLFGMLNAVKSAMESNNSLPSSICFVVDGDLLRTVADMTDGYQVSGPGGRTVPGKGKDFAQRWLNDLRGLTKGRCVMALPYADADLSALAHAGANGLPKQAVEEGVAAVAEVLKPIQPQQSVVWPVNGTLDQRALADLGPGPVTVLANPDRLKGVTGSAPYSIGNARALPIDQLVSGALDTGGPGGLVSVQNGLAALVFRTAVQPAAGRSVLIAPPRRWTAPANELGEYLQTINRLYTDRFAGPQVLPDQLTAPAEGAASGLEYTQQDAGAEVSGQVLAQLTEANTVLWDLHGSMAIDDTRQVNPNEIIAPIRTGLLRAASTAWRGRPDDALRMSADVTDRLTDIRQQVTVSPPGPPITLTSSESPIPVRIGNSLDVAVRVRFAISETSGLRPTEVPERWIPAGSNFTQMIPAELLRAGRFTVDIGLTTVGGTALGNPYRFELSSTSYGTITVVLTSVAAAALVLLVGRRIYRRAKKAKQEQEQISV